MQKRLTIIENFFIGPLNVLCVMSSHSLITDAKKSGATENDLQNFALNTRCALQIER